MPPRSIIKRLCAKSVEETLIRKKCEGRGHRRIVALVHRWVHFFSAGLLSGYVARSACHFAGFLHPASAINSADLYKDVRSQQLTLTGFEPDSVTSQQDSTLGQIANNSAAKSDAVVANSTPIDPNLASLIDVWPSLLPQIRRAILALVENDQ